MRWRRGRDSNLRYPFRYAGFQDRCHQPLGHLSVALIVLLQTAFYGRSDASEAEDRERHTEGWSGLRGYEASHSLLTSVQIITEPCCVIDSSDSCTSLQWRVSGPTQHRISLPVPLRSSPT